MSPRQIVRELDRHIVGQSKAKRAVAVALRNRWRRRQVPSPLRDEIMPFNIILIGPTGVGKTEIARRLATLAQAPFIKVEASRFTEVGYVGRDVESMIRDLVDLSVQRERALELDRLRADVGADVRDRLLELLLPDGLRLESIEESPTSKNRNSLDAARAARLLELGSALERGELEETPVTLAVEDSASQPMMQVFTQGGMEEIASNLQDIIGDLVQRPRRERTMPLNLARRVLEEEEAQERLDMDLLVRRAVSRCEEDGIVFIDEIDKICGPAGGVGPDISRQGVQKDILPVIEGTTVHTKYGLVKTDHMLFIASGAFHVAKPADLIPELQGRFPVRVELEALGRRELERILTEPENALLKQYQALFAAEGVEFTLDQPAVRELAMLAHEANRRAENIGARRLQGLMHLLLEKELFEMPGRSLKRLALGAAEVRERLQDVVENVDLSRYVL